MSAEYLKKRLSEIEEEQRANPRQVFPLWYRQMRAKEAQTETELVRLTAENDARAVQYSQHVYVFPARGFVKIGIASQPKRRWKALKTGNPLLEPPLYVTRKLLYTSKIENAIHRELAAYRIQRSEWFKCNRYFVVEVVKRHEADAR